MQLLHTIDDNKYKTTQYIHILSFPSSSSKSIKNNQKRSHAHTPHNNFSKATIAPYLICGILYDRQTSNASRCLHNGGPLGSRKQYERQAERERTSKKCRRSWAAYSERRESSALYTPTGTLMREQQRKGARTPVLCVCMCEHQETHQEKQQQRELPQF